MNLFFSKMEKPNKFIFLTREVACEIIFVIFVWCVWIITMSKAFNQMYGSDSYAMYMIGHNLFNGDGFVTRAIRDYYLPFQDSTFQQTRSFAPLMPILIGVFEVIFKNGVQAGLYLNLLILLLINYSYMRLCALYANKYKYALFFVLVIFLYHESSSMDSFAGEVIGGRSMPIVLLAIINIIMLEGMDWHKRNSIFIGALLAVMYLARFDMTPFCVAYLIYIGATRGDQFKYVAFTFAVLILPSIIRNYWIFGSIFASDNSLTALSLHPGGVQTSAFIDEKIPMFYENVSLYISQRLNYLVSNINVIISSLGLYFGVFVILASFMPLSKTQSNERLNGVSKVTWIYVSAHLLGLSLTPFSDRRYFAISIFLILSIVALRMFSTGYAGNDNSLLKNKKNLIGCLCFFALIMLPALGVISNITRGQRHSQDVNAPIYGKIYLDFKDLIDEKCLVASPLAEHLAYFSNWKTIYIPGNLGGVNKEFIQWAKKFNVCYAIAPETSYVVHNAPAVIKKSGDYVLIDLATWLKINTQKND